MTQKNKEDSLHLELSVQMVVEDNQMVDEKKTVTHGEITTNKCKQSKNEKWNLWNEHSRAWRQSLAVVSKCGGVTSWWKKSPGVLKGGKMEMSREMKQLDTWYKHLMWRICDRIAYTLLCRGSPPRPWVCPWRKPFLPSGKGEGSRPALGVLCSLA